VNKELCVKCKGTRLLCGKTSCPLLTKYYASLRITNTVKSTELSGASPPSVFIGHHGYPRVYAGPMITPYTEEAAGLDSPEKWINLPLEEIVSRRFSLVRTETKTHIKPEGRIVGIMQETALSRTAPDAEAKLKKKPALNITGEGAAMSPSAKLEKVSISGVKTDHQIEKAYYDTDLKSKDAILQMYLNDVPVSRIHKILSVGGLGIGSKRKLVPTRWSITATDSMLSKQGMKNIRDYPYITQTTAYTGNYYDNNWLIILFPEGCGFEMIEAWGSRSAWNPTASVVIESDREDRKGLKGYPSIGGSYFAARLAITERLQQMRRNAQILVLRHIGPGYTVPVGVWQIREAVRRIMQGRGTPITDSKHMKQHIKENSLVSYPEWFNNSTTLKERTIQHRITQYW